MTAAITPLRTRMIDDMTIRRLAPRTQAFYVSAVAKFARHFARSPDQLGYEDVRAYQLHLVQSWGRWWGRKECLSKQSTNSTHYNINRRTERDSNPRWSFPQTRFPSVRLQPLGHLSRPCAPRDLLGRSGLLRVRFTK